MSNDATASPEPTTHVCAISFRSKPTLPAVPIGDDSWLTGPYVRRAVHPRSNVLFELFSTVPRCHHHIGDPGIKHGFFDVVDDWATKDFHEGFGRWRVSGIKRVPFPPAIMMPSMLALIGDGWVQGDACSFSSKSLRHALLLCWFRPFQCHQTPVHLPTTRNSRAYRQLHPIQHRFSSRP